MNKDDMDFDENDSEDESSDEMQEEDDEKNETKANAADKEVYLPGKPLAEGEELICDQTAYVMLHQAQTGAPCLSFDIVKDNLGDERNNFPLTAYLVAGTQAEQGNLNNIIVMKLSNMHKTNSESEDQDDEEDDDDDDDNSKNPQMMGAQMKHQGCVNRIRCTAINNTMMAATWSELGRINIWNITQQLQTTENSQLLSKYQKENVSNSVMPIFTFSGHQAEGFALDWCQTSKGVLATGDCRSNIHIWYPTEGGSWKVDQRPLLGHTQSVEDLQWSPNEPNVLASCSVDRTIRIWDVRAPPNKACMITNETCHESDVNVISWNKNEPFIVSGGDDGILHIWDLRQLQKKIPIATFKHHTEPVTTVEWHPTDSAVFASGGDDNQISLWDLSVERDLENREDEVEGIPPQLLFIHQGQKCIKELHWHPQIPGLIISTALTGFNIFKTISV